MPGSCAVGAAQARQAGQVYFATSTLPDLRHNSQPRREGQETMIERDNYLLVKEYLAYQAEVLLRDPETVNRKRLWLRHILRWADNKPFHEAPGVRPVFPRYLATAQRAESSGKALTAVGVERGCQEARAFFEWIGRTYPRQHRAITPTWISTLQPPAMPTEPPREHQAVTLEAVRRLMVVRSEPGDLMTMRDKAAAAVLFLSGARASPL